MDAHMEVILSRDRGFAWPSRCLQMEEWVCAPFGPTPALTESHLPVQIPSHLPSFPTLCAYVCYSFFYVPTSA